MRTLRLRLDLSWSLAKRRWKRRLVYRPAAMGRR